MDRKSLMEKWSPILEHEGVAPIKDTYRKEVTAVLLENQEKAIKEEKQAMFEAVHVNDAAALPDTGGVAKFDPVLISLVRRSAPQMIAYDICGVQPMTQPTGLIFAMKARYETMSGSEALYDAADTSYSSNSNYSAGSISPGLLIASNGSSTGVANAEYGAATAKSGFQGGIDTATGEGMTPANMAFSIEKVTVTARTRALRADYTMEVAQDLKAVHGLDAETELSNILSAEILGEINREVVRSIYLDAKIGAQSNTTRRGAFDLDTDSNGRWSVEKFKGLMFQIEREANAVAKDTRRGKGNIIITSSDVASALQMAGVLDYAPALDSNGLTPDDTGNTFVGVLNGRYRVYIDPYAASSSTNTASNYFVVGYKGSSSYDAGLFYCPYVPLQMVRAVSQTTFQPKIGFKTRYGLVRNPFAEGTGESSSTADYDIQNQTLATAGNRHNNVYYRLVRVNNLM